MKGFSALPKASVSLEPNQDIVFFWGGVLFLCREAVGIYDWLSRLGIQISEKEKNKDDVGWLCFKYINPRELFNVKSNTCVYMYNRFVNK